MADIASPGLLLSTMRPAASTAARAWSALVGATLTLADGCGGGVGAVVGVEGCTVGGVAAITGGLVLACAESLSARRARMREATPPLATGGRGIDTGGGAGSALSALAVRALLDASRAAESLAVP